MVSTVQNELALLNGEYYMYMSPSHPVHPSHKRDNTLNSMTLYLLSDRDINIYHTNGVYI